MEFQAHQKKVMCVHLENIQTLLTGKYEYAIMRVISLLSSS
jgi:hypothetical protein